MTRFLTLLTSTKRFETLFSMSDSELARRGYSRAGLTRAYVSGLSAN